MKRKYTIEKRIRRKRNFLIHLTLYIAMGIFFFGINLASYNGGDDWWFFYPLLPLFLVLAVHFVFSVGKDYLEVVAARWEEKESGERLLEEEYDDYEDEYGESEEYDQENLDLDEYNLKERLKERRYREDDL
ncbi:MAG TPA: 2TM domain-containing protein [Saprospiraceae bacterium]|nr:2TM domain-containing protein [Saprospiraceae bacterium]